MASTSNSSAPEVQPDGTSPEPDTPETTERAADAKETTGSPVWAFVLTLFLQGGGLAYASARFREGIQAALVLAIAPPIFVFLYALTEWRWLLVVVVLLVVGLVVYFAIKAARLANVARVREKVLLKVALVYLVSFALSSLAARAARTWAAEPFRVSASSMEPTLSAGDHFFVNKMAYGLWNPFSNTKKITGQGPRRGDVIVFVYPSDPRKDFVKRVIGLPGDTIALKNGALFLNGKSIAQTRIGPHSYSEFEPPQWKKRTLMAYRETLYGTSYTIAKDTNNPSFLRSWDANTHGRQLPDLLVPGSKKPRKRAWGPKVPKGHVFVLGDNRDHSSDSREWGLVPFENIKGRATFIWLSIGESFRWDRINKTVR